MLARLRARLRPRRDITTEAGVTVQTAQRTAPASAAPAAGQRAVPSPYEDGTAAEPTPRRPMSSASTAEDIEIATCGALRAAHLIALQQTADRISTILGEELATGCQDAQDLIGQGQHADSRALSANLPAVNGPDRHLHVLRAASLISQQLEDAEVLQLLDQEFRHLPGWDAAAVLTAGHAVHQTLIQASN
ncbi:hypothetical protein ACIO6T_37925 [Streptomyces sp. NPDC087532]|uniref:hypothetical protein n=1 Tax=Streptomyces sp. NPDC087532 TaxID=3365795 RepID=UPI00382ABD5A